MRCVPLLQSSAFVVFPDLHSACAAASVLRDKTAVDAVEMFDRASLRCNSVIIVVFGFYQKTSIKRLKGCFRGRWLRRLGTC